MKLAIVGSRTFNDYELLEKSILDKFDLKNIDLIVSGGAVGADKLGEKFAEKHSIEPLILKPDWNKYGKRAGYERNKDIIKNCDTVIAFWNGESPGTKHSIDIAKASKKEVIIVNF
jgi:hypothetical protein